MIHIGVTGTRAPIQHGQAKALKELLTDLRKRAAYNRQSVVLHHGKCPFGGVDAYAHQLALKLRFQVVMHPMILTSDAQAAAMDYATQKLVYRGTLDMPGMVTQVLPERSETRNREIAGIAANASWQPVDNPEGRLYALPLLPERDPGSVRSGTWQTVRFARCYGGAVTIIDTVGAITDDRPCSKQTDQ